MNSPQTISVQNPPALAFSLPLVASFLAPIRQLSVSLTNQGKQPGGAQANNEVKAAWAANNAMLEVLTFGLFDFVTTAAAYAICLTSGEFSGAGKPVWLSPSMAAGLTLTWPGSPRVGRAGRVHGGHPRL